ncbi:hypothetical protein STEG23_006604, partial [Scotinomys teguina]
GKRVRNGVTKAKGPRGTVGLWANSREKMGEEGRKGLISTAGPKDESLARQLVELGYRGTGEIVKREDFEARKAAIDIAKQAERTQKKVRDKELLFDLQLHLRLFVKDADYPLCVEKCSEPVFLNSIFTNRNYLQHLKSDTRLGESYHFRNSLFTKISLFDDVFLILLYMELLNLSIHSAREYDEKTELCCFVRIGYVQYKSYYGLLLTRSHSRLRAIKAVNELLQNSLGENKAVVAEVTNAGRNRVLTTLNSNMIASQFMTSEQKQQLEPLEAC